VFFSLEALLSLLASLYLITAAISYSSSPPPSLARLYEYQVLNDFLEVRSKVGLSNNYVASSGFCLMLIKGDETSFLPSECSHTPPQNPISTSRIVYDGGKYALLNATLWRR